LCQGVSSASNGGLATLKVCKATESYPIDSNWSVTLENAPEFLLSGAIAVGISGQLFPQQLVVTGNWEAIAQRARNLIQQLARPYTSWSMMEP